jgi:hypothetical protein
MEDKKTFLLGRLPRAVLEPLTPETVEAVPEDRMEDGCLVIHHFPFRIGRESRVAMVKGRLERVERPGKGSGKPNNDLYLVDRGHRLNISREHFLIEKNDSGYLLVDRCSACGTKVNGENVGGEDFGGSTPIRDGDVISIGAAGTPYVLRFVTFEEYEITTRK